MSFSRQSNNDYSPRRLSTHGRGYSVFVRILKFTMPLVALIIIGVLISRLSEDTQQQVTMLPQEEKTTPGEIELIQAKYEGTDSEGRPYTVSADKASRAMDAPDSVVFDNPLADITLQDKTWVAVKARSGSFDRNAETLKLKKDVTVFHDSGYEMAMDDIAISLKDKTAKSESPVTAHGPMGSITGQNMTVSDDGNLIVFGGPATLTIFSLTPPKKARG